MRFFPAIQLLGRPKKTTLTFEQLRQSTIDAIALIQNNACGQAVRESGTAPNIALLILGRTEVNQLQ